MKRRQGIFVLALSLLTLGYASGDSIWDRREPRSAFLFSDGRARRIGDTLTILISEVTGINNNDQRQMNKNTATSGSFGFKGDTKAGKLARDASIDFNANGTSNRTFNGKSQYTANDSMTDRIAVTVVDVLPNGNLVVEGFRRRLVEGEDRTVRVTGIVRPDDITLQNLVPSQVVANFQIQYVGKGPDSHFVNQNYLGRILNLLWPF